MQKCSPWEIINWRVSIFHTKKCQLGNKGEKKLFLARRKIGVGVGLNFNIHFDEAK